MPSAFSSHISISFKWAALFSLQSLLSVASGAFAAHALAELISPTSLSWWSTGSQYLMYHSLAGLVVSLTLAFLPRVQAILFLFLFGNIFFVGSLYVMALTDFRALGAMTPLGGMFYLLAWGSLVFQLWRFDKAKTFGEDVKK